MDWYLRRIDIIFRCPAEPNTFISLTRTHETRFHFQDFEYAFKPDSMYVYCNATFCPVNDYSNACEPRCHSKRVANDVEDSSGVTIDREQTNGPIDYAEDEAVIYFRSGNVFSFSHKVLCWLFKC